MSPVVYRCPCGVLMDEAGRPATPNRRELKYLHCPSCGLLAFAPADPDPVSVPA